MARRLRGGGAAQRGVLRRRQRGVLGLAVPGHLPRRLQRCVALGERLLGGGQRLGVVLQRLAASAHVPHGLADSAREGLQIPVFFFGRRLFGKFVEAGTQIR